MPCRTKSVHSTNPFGHLNLDMGHGIQAAGLLHPFQKTRAIDFYSLHSMLNIKNRDIVMPCRTKSVHPTAPALFGARYSWTKARHLNLDMGHGIQAAGLLHPFQKTRAIDFYSLHSMLNIKNRDIVMPCRTKSVHPTAPALFGARYSWTKARHLNLDMGHGLQTAPAIMRPKIPYQRYQQQQPKQAFETKSANLRCPRSKN